jgi:quercetin dioxygenase-like cupin family protein
MIVCLPELRHEPHIDHLSASLTDIDHRPRERGQGGEPPPVDGSRFQPREIEARPELRRTPVNQSRDRIMKPVDALFRAARDIPEESIHAIEGAAEQGELSVKVLMVTENFVMLRIWRGKGLIDPVHQHDDHESVATLLSGKLKMWIGDEEFVAGPGDVWRHPPGVPHYSEALEECEQIEIKSPARKTWT